MFSFDIQFTIPGLPMYTNDRRGSMVTKKICIVIPAYNEGSVLADVLAGLPHNHNTGKLRLQFDVVVVDDGSADNTADVAANVAGVNVVQHVINMGAGAATRTGLRFARSNGYDMAITADADGQHASSDVLALAIRMTQEPPVDLLIGSRLRRGTGNMPTHKRLGNIGLSYLTFLLLGTYVTDSQSGLRAYSRDCLERLCFHSNNYAFCSEMVWQAKRSGLIVAEHPIQAIYTDYSRRKGQKSISGAMKILQQLIARRFMDLLQ